MDLDAGMTTTFMESFYKVSGSMEGRSMVSGPVHSGHQLKLRSDRSAMRLRGPISRDRGIVQRGGGCYSLV